MDLAIKIMDFSTVNHLPVFRSQQFRTPLRAERAVGLWVDRIGMNSNRMRPNELRELGLYAVVYIETGDGTFISPPTGQVALQPGDVLRLFPDVPTLYYPHSSWVEKSIVWHGPDMQALQQVGYFSPDNMVIPDPTRAVARAHAALADLMGDEDLVAVLERKNIIMTMILELFRSTRHNEKNRHNDRLMRQAVAFLAQHYPEDIAIPQLARRFRLSTTHFRRRFREYTGRSPREFITSMRISKAKELITHGKSVKEAAWLVGYEDPFYFMRVFKNVVGVPPGRFGHNGL